MQSYWKKKKYELGYKSNWEFHVVNTAVGIRNKVENQS